MSFIASLPAGSQAWLLNSPLAPQLDAFSAHLADGRFSVQTTRNHFLGVAHFARWMTQCAQPVSLVDERSVQQFLGIHLPHCSCPPPAVSDPSMHRISLGHLMVVLRRLGVVAEVPPAIGPIPDELRRFDQHMRNSRGLAIHVSGLAVHTRNLQARVNISLMVRQSELADEPVHALARVMFAAQAKALQPGSAAWQTCRTAYLTRFPLAETMTQLGDFMFFALQVSSARQIAGFGAARSIDAEEVSAALRPPV